jgi:hypothetical protein
MGVADMKETVAEFKDAGYEISEHTISIKRVNYFSIMVGCCLGWFLLPHLFASNESLPRVLQTISSNNEILRDLAVLILFVILSIFIIPIHEFLHGIGGLPNCDWKWKGNIKITFEPKKMIAYCHCPKPIGWKDALRVVLFPLFVISGISLIIAMITHLSIWWLAFMMNTLGSIGDLLYAYLLIRYRPQLILDSPDGVGFIAVNKKD